jgi:RND family efflux transporter MFP subunit
MITGFERPAPARRRAAVRAGAALCAGLLAGCGASESAAPETRLVRSIVVTDGAGAETMTYTAEIRSRYETDLAFQVGGKLVSRRVDAGASVHRGDVLAQLDPTDYRLGVEAARSAVDAAAAELARARSDEARYRDLLERGLTTRASYLAQQTTAMTSRSRLDQATADLRLSEQQLAYATLRADDDGIVMRTMVEAGAVVAAGQPVVSIARPSELEAVFDVPDGHVDDIRHASTLRLDLLTGAGAHYDVAVREIAPNADPVTRTYEVKASVPEGANLRLGTTVKVTASRADARASVALPAAALFQKDQEPAVWVVRADQTLELRPVAVERYESDRVLIAGGLAAGDRVVTAGVHRLSAGESVRLLAEARP